MECFAFGGATVHFAPLETSFHAANHTIPPPPSYEGYPLCPKDKNRSPFHGEKTPDGKKFLGRRLYQISQTILPGRDAILRVRVKWLIFNMVLQLWADVKYHVPTIAQRRWLNPIFAKLRQNRIFLLILAKFWLDWCVLFVSLWGLHDLKGK